MLIAPSSAIAWWRRAISACSAVGRSLAFGRLRKRRLVGARVGELLRELLHRQPRRLLLQPELAGPLAQGRKLLLAPEPLLVRGTKPLRGVVLPAAHRSELLLAVHARDQGRLQRHPQTLVLEPRKLGFGAAPGPLQLARFVQIQLQ